MALISSALGSIRCRSSMASNEIVLLSRAFTAVMMSSKGMGGRRRLQIATFFSLVCSIRLFSCGVLMAGTLPGSGSSLPPAFLMGAGFSLKASSKAEKSISLIILSSLVVYQNVSLVSLGLRTASCWVGSRYVVLWAGFTVLVSNPPTGGGGGGPEPRGPRPGGAGGGGGGGPIEGGGGGAGGAGGGGGGATMDGRDGVPPDCDEERLELEAVFSWSLSTSSSLIRTSMMESRFLPSSSLFCTVRFNVLYSVSTSCLFIFRSLISCSSSSIRFS